MKNIHLFALLVASISLVSCGPEKHRPEKVNQLESVKKVVDRLENAPNIIEDRTPRKSSLRKKAAYSEKTDFVGPDMNDGNTDFGNFYNFLTIKEHIDLLYDEINSVLEDSQTPFNVWVSKSLGQKVRLSYVPSLNYVFYDNYYFYDTVKRCIRSSFTLNEDGKLIFTEEDYSLAPDGWREFEDRFTYQKFRYIEDESYEHFSYQYMMNSDLEFNRWYSYLNFDENVIKAYMHATGTTDDLVNKKVVPNGNDWDRYYEMDLGMDGDYKLMTESNPSGPQYSLAEFRIYDSELRNVNRRLFSLSLREFEGIDSISYGQLPYGDSIDPTLIITLANGATIVNDGSSDFPQILTSKYSDPYGNDTVRAYIYFPQNASYGKVETTLAIMDSKYGVKLKFDFDKMTDLILDKQDETTKRYRNKEYMEAFKNLIEQHMVALKRDVFETLEKGFDLKQSPKDAQLYEVVQSINGLITVNENVLDLSSLTVSIDKTDFLSEGNYYFDLFLSSKYDHYLIASQEIDYKAEIGEYKITLNNVDLTSVDIVPGEYELKLFLKDYIAYPNVSLKGSNIDFTDAKGRVYSLKDDGTLKVAYKASVIGA